MSEVKIFASKGFMGSSPGDTPLDTFLRQLAIKASKDPKGEWAEKYGTEISNDVFVMHPYCWCEQEDCPYCFDYEEDDNNCTFHRFPTKEMKDKYGISDEQTAPNFWYKPLDLKIWWYKYIGRGMEINKSVSVKQLNEILIHCLKSIRK